MCFLLSILNSFTEYFFVNKICTYFDEKQINTQGSSGINKFHLKSFLSKNNTTILRISVYLISLLTIT